MNVTNVTIRNLTIRNMPKKGIHDRESCVNWTVENCEVHHSQWGVVMTAGLVLRNSKLHHNGQGIIAGNYSLSETNVYQLLTNLVENNEISFGGPEQKAMNSGVVVWRRNWFHHNEFAGLWNDGDGNGSTIEDNLSEDNASEGMHIEISMGFQIRRNTLRRNNDQGIFVSTSGNLLIEDNTIEDNFRGLTISVNCFSTTQGWPWRPDLTNNVIRNNTIRTSTRTGEHASVFSYASAAYDTNNNQINGCTSGQLVPYDTNTKNNQFIANTYYVPSVTGGYWSWINSRDFAGWQALGQDTAGTVNPR